MPSPVRLSQKKTLKLVTCIKWLVKIIFKRLSGHAFPGKEGHCKGGWRRKMLAKNGTL
jgi:hypothetical protein